MENYAEKYYLDFIKKLIKLQHRHDPIAFEEAREFRLELLRAITESCLNNHKNAFYHVDKASKTNISTRF
jgi:hypothetical protein